MYSQVGATKLLVNPVLCLPGLPCRIVIACVQVECMRGEISRDDDGLVSVYAMFCRLKQILQKGQSVQEKSCVGICCFETAALDCVSSQFYCCPCIHIPD